MDRRIVMLGLAAAAGVGGSALAQTTTSPPATTAPGAGAGTGAGAGATHAGGMAMGQPEMDYGMKTGMAGAAALMMADLGLQKASNAKVKQFAQFEHDEQTTIADILKSMNPNMTPPKPDAQAQATIDKLKGMSGADFDRTFIQGQTEGHQKLLAIQEEYLKAGKNREAMNVAKLARGQIKEHLVLLSDLQKGMG